MARSDQLRRLLASYAEADDREFRRTAAEMIADERRKNHRNLADDLERALNRNRRAGGEDALSLRPIPKSRDERPLLTLTKPRRDLAELVLSEETSQVIEDVIRENLSRTALTNHALRPRQRLLFVGPPGTGKSATAHALAAELSLPVATVTLASITSSLLGDTARNLEAVLAYAEQVPCVLLFDEFDVVAQDRGTERDHGELRRVAATLLQLMEELHGESIVVATSNHPRLVDSAMWRRFDEIVGFGSLGQDQLAALLDLRMRAMRPTFDRDTWARRLASLSPAEVELVCLDAQRRAVLAGSNDVDEDAMEGALGRMLERRRLLQDETTQP
ncbi:hypothetical protein BJF85_05600 [Saccharomonospora sp. CUA-673]|nr:hypothetical protein BJF85_05600 [Saccharomonospora sp. CUA-673]